MPSPPRRTLLLALLALLLLPSVARAADVAPLFELTRPEGAPFPSDRYTVPDPTQLTGVRVALPKPSCAVFPPTAPISTS
jgi:hypothetical protein